MLDNVLGSKLRIVTGYAGSSEIILAVERNEVQGVCLCAQPNELGAVVGVEVVGVEAVEVPGRGKADQVGAGKESHP